MAFRRIRRRLKRARRRLRKTARKIGRGARAVGRAAVSAARSPIGRAALTGAAFAALGPGALAVKGPALSKGLNIARTARRAGRAVRRGARNVRRSVRATAREVGREFRQGAGIAPMQSRPVASARRSGRAMGTQRQMKAAGMVAAGGGLPSSQIAAPGIDTSTNITTLGTAGVASGLPVPVSAGGLVPTLASIAMTPAIRQLFSEFLFGVGLMDFARAVPEAPWGQWSSNLRRLFRQWWSDRFKELPGGDAPTLGGGFSAMPLITEAVPVTQLRAPKGYVMVDVNGQKVAMLEGAARQFRLWRPRRKPPITAADLAAINRAARAKKRIKALDKKVDSITGVKIVRRKASS